MTVEDLLPRLEAVRRSSRGYMARCPVHADHSPSLSIREADDGRILVHCFSGCTIESICRAIDCRVADLYPNERCRGYNSEATRSQPHRVDWQSTAWRFQFHAFLFWLRAESVLEAARDLETSSWSDEERNRAMQAVASAYRDLEQAELLENVAFGVRARGLEKERHVNHTHAA